MRRLVLGVIGHVDHGKTALVRALTGKDTDALAEEKQRGISIALGFAHLRVGGGYGHRSDRHAGPRAFCAHDDLRRDRDRCRVAGRRSQRRDQAADASSTSTSRACWVYGGRVVAISKTDLVAPEQARRVADEAVRCSRARASKRAAARHDLGAARKGPRRSAPGTCSAGARISIRAPPTVWHSCRSIGHSASPDMVRS